MVAAAAAAAAASGGGGGGGGGGGSGGSGGSGELHAWHTQWCWKVVTLLQLMMATNV